MASQLFLTNATAPVGGVGQLALSTARGTSSTNAVTNTTASGTSIPCTATGGGTALTWWYQVGAGTISGNVTANIRGLESNASANAGVGLVIDLYAADHATLIGNLLTSNVPSTATEFTTSDAAKVLASTALTSRTAVNGSWIKVTLNIINVGTMGGSFTATISYNGPTSGSAGDTSITFANNLPVYKPILEWSFDEASGTAYDSSGNGRAGTVNARTTGHTGSAAVGDSTHSAASYSGTLVTTPQAMTQMFWYYPTDNTTLASFAVLGVAAAASSGTGVSGWLSPFWEDSTHIGLGFRNAAGSGVVHGPASVTSALNTWVHVACVWDGVANTITLYLDGVNVYSNAVTGVLGTPAWAEVGGWGGNSNFNMGRIDDHRVYASALTATEISTLKGVAPASSGIVDSGVVTYPNGSGSTTFVLPMPLGVQTGDIVVVEVVGATAGVTLTPPSGQTVISAVQDGNLVGTTSVGAVYGYTVPSSSVPSSLTWTWGSSQTGDLVWTVIRGFTLTGMSAATSGNYAAATTAVAPAVTAAAGALLIGGVHGAFASSSTISNPSGWTTIQQGARRKGHLASKGTVSAGSTGTTTWTISGLESVYAWQVALPVASSTPSGTIAGTSTASLTSPTGRWIKPVGHAAWYTGGKWAACLPTSGGFKLFADLSSPSAGATVDSRQDARAYAVYDSNWVGIVRGHPTQSRFSSFTISGSTYTAAVTDTVVPLTPDTLTGTPSGGNDASPISIVKSPNGYLWCAILAGGNVQVSRSTDSGATWGSAQTIAALGGTGVAATGMAALSVTGTTVVLLVNRNDGNDPKPRAWSIPQASSTYTSSDWTSETMPALDSGCATDDHLSTTVLPNGTLIAVGKTTNASANIQLIFQLIRTTAGSWSISTILSAPDDSGSSYTRPGITLVGNTLYLTYGQFGSPLSLYSRTASVLAPTTWGSPTTLATGPSYADGAILPDAASIAAAGGNFPILAHELNSAVITIPTYVTLTPTFTYAIVGGASSSGFKVKAKTTNTATFRIKVGTNSAVTSGVVYGTSGDADADGWAESVVSGLSPATQYYYMLEFSPGSGYLSALVGDPRTFPTAGAAANFSFALASCFDDSDSIAGAFSRAYARDPDLWLHMGDWDYLDNVTSSQSGHLADMEHSLSQSTGLRTFTQSRALTYSKSDHDAGGGNNSFPGIWTAPNQAATKQMFPYPTLPASDGLYHSFVVGRVRFIIMDTRSYANTGTGTRLGATQLAWVKARLLDPEPLKILMTENTWADNRASGVYGADSWAAFNTERTDIGNAIAAAVGKVIIIHGDSHAIAMDDGTHNLWGGAPMICGAPWKQGSSRKTNSDSDWSQGVWPSNANLGSVEQQYVIASITDSGAAITASFQGYATDDSAHISLTVTAPDVASGTSVATSTTTGTATVKQPASGTSVAVSTATGTASTSGSQAASGTSAAVSATSGTATVKHPTSGITAAVSVASGTATETQAATGTSVAVSSVAGAATEKQVASGTSVAVSSTTGAATETQTASGTSVAVSGTTGAATEKQNVSGTSTAVSVATGAATETQPASGTSVAVSVASGSASAQDPAVVNASGTSVATSSTSGTATEVQAASGTSVAVSATTGAATEAQVASGTAASTSSTTGAATVQHPAVGQVNAISSTSGTPTTAQSTSGGTSTAVSTTTGTPTEKQAASGTSVAISTADGVATTSGLQIASGTSVATSSTAGAASVKHPASGVSPAVSTATGAPTTQQTASGTITAVSTATGTASAQNTLDASGVASSLSSTAGAAKTIHTVASIAASHSDTLGDVLLTQIALGIVVARSQAIGHAYIPGASSGVTVDLLISGQVVAVGGDTFRLKYNGAEVPVGLSVMQGGDELIIWVG